MDNLREILYSILRTFLIFTLFTILILLIILGLNSLMILFADTLPIEEKSEDSKIGGLELYDFPETQFDKDVVEETRINYYREGFDKGSSIDSNITRKYSSEKKIIFTEHSVRYDLENNSRTVLTESVTYLDPTDDNPYRINRTSVFEGNRDSGERQTSRCGSYTMQKNLYQVEFNNGRYDRISKYFPNRWDKRTDNSQSMQGISQFEINSFGDKLSSSDNRLYALSQYEGSVKREENGSENISISQDMRMATNPILTLTPLATDLSLQYEYNRTVVSNASVEEPMWVDEARNCLETTND